MINIFKRKSKESQYWWLTIIGNQFTIEADTEYFAKKRTLQCINKHIHDVEYMSINIPVMAIVDLKVSERDILRQYTFSELIDKGKMKEDVLSLWNIYIQEPNIKPFG